jgi:GR25 family glycosyltransferase involved in LPS biosynthesis
MNNAWVNHVDLFVYINLAHRVDRRCQIIAELAALGVPHCKIHRILATNHSQGFTGCTHSHLRALQYAASMSNVSRVCVLEDDFCVVSSLSLFHASVSSLLACRFDVGQITINPVQLTSTRNNNSDVNVSPTVVQVKRSLGFAAYVVDRQYFPVMLKLFQTSLQIQKPHDVVAQRYQGRDRWLGIFPPVAGQRPGFSDIQRHLTDYSTWTLGALINKNQ